MNNNSIVKLICKFSSMSIFESFILKTFLVLHRFQLKIHSINKNFFIYPEKINEKNIMLN